MKGKRPTTVAEYIEATPSAGRSHLDKVRSILKGVAPGAQEVIKWGNPFFVEPRFLYAYSAHKGHLSFAPGPAAMEAFSDELKSHLTTKYFLKIPYTKPVPEELVLKMAEFCLKSLSGREDEGFW